MDPKGSGHAYDQLIPHLDQVGDPEREESDAGKQQGQRQAKEPGGTYRWLLSGRLDVKEVEQIAVIRCLHSGVGRFRHGLHDREIPAGALCSGTHSAHRPGISYSRMVRKGRKTPVGLMRISANIAFCHVTKS